MRLDDTNTTKRRLYLKKKENPEFGKDGRSKNIHLKAAPSQRSNSSNSASVDGAPPPPNVEPATNRTQPPAQPPVEFDFFNGGQASSSVTTGSPVTQNDIDESAPSAPAEVLNREELQAKREEEIQGKVEAALQFKKEVSHLT